MGGTGGYAQAAPFLVGQCDSISLARSRRPVLEGIPPNWRAGTEWLGDSLPRLSMLRVQKGKFDLAMLTAVGMEGVRERRRAMAGSPGTAS